MKKIHSMISCATMAALTLPSCTTVNPYTGEQQTSKTMKGGVMGALGGAAIGALTGDSDAALKGAMIGGLVGGGIGSYMDTQEAEVRRQLHGTGVSVTRNGDDLILNMPSDITFRSGSANLQPEFSQTLGSVALVLKKYNRTSISIVGNTDSDGSAASNQSLSISRARSVAGVLNSRGVAGNRLLTLGQGESRPVASNATSAGKAKNRRVELRIIPQQKQF
ncbi:MAG: outer membrane protein OmpA-like peptidoglycan-associated protein [Cryomorphaceae bacterium]|jgi:outer membrane protein OmpA-like peptidoglycan-associated protein